MSAQITLTGTLCQARAEIEVRVLVRQAARRPRTAPFPAAFDLVVMFVGVLLTQPRPCWVGRRLALRGLGPATHFGLQTIA